MLWTHYGGFLSLWLSYLLFSLREGYDQRLAPVIVPGPTTCYTGNMVTTSDQTPKNKPKPMKPGVETPKKKPRKKVAKK